MTSFTQTEIALFREIQCKSGSVGLATNDLKPEMGFYNIHKCGVCGRKWHIYETAPICQKYRKEYPEIEDFLLASHTRLLKEVGSKVEKADIAEDKVGSFQDGYRCFKVQVLTLLSSMSGEIISKED